MGERFGVTFCCEKFWFHEYASPYSDLWMCTRSCKRKLKVLRVILASQKQLAHHLHIRQRSSVDAPFRLMETWETPTDLNENRGECLLHVKISFTGVCVCALILHTRTHKRTHAAAAVTPPRLSLWGCCWTSSQNGESKKTCLLFDCDRLTPKLTFTTNVSYRGRNLLSN